jgi:hypothetical protein
LDEHLTEFSCNKGKIRDFQRELDMLVLSRQKDQSIMIGDDVEIIIVDVRGQRKKEENPG